MLKDFFIKIDKFLDRHTGFLLCLLLLIILRAPNFFDPYWYGDEAIYLTIGQSIRAGKQLYAEIVDHKTPIIYYLAAVPNQFWFRVLLTGWMVTTTTFFYDLSRKIFNHKNISVIGTFIFVLLTTLPWLEGHIPNGELFVMGFVITGLWILAKSQYLSQVLDDQPIIKSFHKKQIAFLIISGFFYGLAFLTKVPAILDFAGLLLLSWFFTNSKVLNQSNSTRKRKIFFTKKNFLALFQFIPQWIVFFIGLLIPVIISIIYFVSIGAGSDYLEFGLLYNLHYTQTWTHDFGSAFVNSLFTLPVKTLILAIFILLLTILKKVSLKAKFFTGWYLLTLYSVLLSNRPYPHYFLQAVPPLVLMVTYLLKLAIDKQKKVYEFVSSFLLFIVCGTLTTLILFSLNFGVYSTRKYYGTFFKYVKGNLNQEEYFQSFNYLMSDNYQVANYLKSQNEKKLFIWGNNALLYALSETVPSSRYTVAFHILDMNAFDETIMQVKDEEPNYIVLMNNAPTEFPEFYHYLRRNYVPIYSYTNMTLYKRVNIQ